MSAVVNSYRDLLVWQKAMDVAALSYEIGGKLPKSEIFGLTSQIQRAAVSIAANIAEGHGRETTGDYLRFLAIASGSLTELETHLLLSQRLGLIKDDEVKPARKKQMNWEKCSGPQALSIGEVRRTKSDKDPFTPRS